MPSSSSSNKKKNLLKTLLTAANCGCGRAPKPSHPHHPPSISKAKSSHNQKNPLPVPNPPPPPSSSSVNNEKNNCSASTSTSTVTKSELSEEIIKEGCEMMMNDIIAVVKESEEPYKDFRHSMLQMMFEKEIFSKQDLQRLLNCFLQLNSPSQHPVIIQVYTEICDHVISKNSPGDGD